MFLAFSDLPESQKYIFFFQIMSPAFQFIFKLHILVLFFGYVFSDGTGPGCFCLVWPAFGAHITLYPFIEYLLWVRICV